MTILGSQCLGGILGIHQHGSFKIFNNVWSPTTNKQTAVQSFICILAMLLCLTEAAATVAKSCCTCLHDLPNKGLSSMQLRSPESPVSSFTASRKAGMFSTKLTVLPHMDLHQKKKPTILPPTCLRRASSWSMMP